MLLEAAMTIARQSGDMIRSQLDGSYGIHSKNGIRDLATDIDRRSESMIQDYLGNRFPSIGFLGEEQSFDATRTSFQTLSTLADDEYLWVVDPLDGTTNFVRQLPLYVVSIALVKGKEILLAVVYDPSHRELFSASKGGGAFLNGKPMRISANQGVEDSIVSVSLPVIRQEFREKAVAFITNYAPVCTSMRICNCSELNFAYVAAGRMEAHIEMDVYPWDLVAGVLLIREAGGEVSGLQGEPFCLDFPSAIGSNGWVHPEVVRYFNLGV